MENILIVCPDKLVKCIKIDELLKYRSLSRKITILEKSKNIEDYNFILEITKDLKTTILEHGCIYYRISYNKVNWYNLLCKTK